MIDAQRGFSMINLFNHLTPMTRVIRQGVCCSFFILSLLGVGGASLAFSQDASQYTPRPSIQVRDDQKEALLKKIEEHRWAEISHRRLVSTVDRYLAMYLEDKEKFLSRMIMNRRRGVRYTRYYGYPIDAKLQEWFTTKTGLPESPYTLGVIGFGDAPVPTPLYWYDTNLPRIEGKDVRFPNKVEDWPAETEAKEPGWGFPATHPVTKEPFPYWTTDPTPICGHVVYNNYEQFFRLAKQAGFLYWLTGREDYAKLGADIVLLFCRGAQYIDFSYQHMKSRDRVEAEQYRRHELGKPSDPAVLDQWIEEGKACSYGPFMTRHPIHSKNFSELGKAVDLLLPYLHAQKIDTAPIDKTLKKVCEASAFAGRYEGNINWHEALPMVACALALENDSHYTDGRGRDFYMQYFINKNAKHSQHIAAELIPETKQDQPSQSCVSTALELSHETVTGLLKETFGYMNTSNYLLECVVMAENAGYPVIKTVPNALKASYGKVFYLFPGGSNGPNYGDGHANKLSIISLEYAYALAVANDLQDRKLIAHHIHQYYQGKRDKIYHIYNVEKLSSLVGEIEDVNANEVARSIPRVNELPYAGCIIQRNRYDAPDNAVMAVVMGAQFGHAHRNGMSLEAFAKGRIFAVDGHVPGAWYDSKVHQKYISRPAAHNNVIINTKSCELGHVHPVHQDPQTGPAAFEVSQRCSFTDTAYDSPDTNGHQRRAVGIVRVAPTSALLVDIFRSKTRDGSDVTHDYVYHNVGDVDAILDPRGQPLAMTPSEELREDNPRKQEVGYALIKPRQVEAAAMPKDFATVRFAHDDAERGDRLITRMWNRDAEKRTLFRVNRRKVTNEDDPNLEGKSFPDDGMIVVRQHGEAWSRPFVSVFDNYLSDEGSAIKSIVSLPDVPAMGELVGLRIATDPKNQKHLIDTRNVIVLNAIDTEKTHELKKLDIAFAGAYAVIGTGDESSWMYLGRGGRLRRGDVEIKSPDNSLLSANLKILKDGSYEIATDSAVLVTLPVPQGKTVTLESLNGTEMVDETGIEVKVKGGPSLRQYRVAKDSRIRFMIR